ncbi:tyrosine--tRNA ligase [Candidatus Woesearchaeota archaeon]|nr:tyrosine--tRNA ligase [Candidatus Woesearchaeota archaeon]
MNVEEKLALLKRNTQEIITEEELRKLLQTKKKPAVYLGTSVTGSPHIGYFVWVTKMADFMKAGFKVKVLLADIHGALDKTPWPLLEKRYEYYNIIIPAIFESIGADLNKLELIKGSDFQLKKDYMFDVLKLSTFVTVHDATRAASEVVKMGDSPKLAGLLYPLMQSIDEEYLKVDVQYGGVDQRKILVFARENLPKLGYKPRVEFMTPLIPGLTASGKMSSSEKGSKIDLLDDEKTVNDRLNAAYCPEKQVENNGVLAFLKHVIMTHKADKGQQLTIERPEKFGGPLTFKTYEEIERAYTDGKLHPMDLKKAAAKEINALLAPIRAKFTGKEQLIREAYPE